MHLARVVLRVPDPEAAAAFYQRVLGLGLTGRGAGGAVRLSCRPAAAVAVPDGELLLVPGSTPALEAVALALDTAALATAVGTLHAQGHAVEGPHPAGGAGGPGLWVRDPDGLGVELGPPAPAVPRPAGAAPFELLRLGHVTRRSPDPARVARWWQDMLGFRVSDQMGEEFVWLRCNRDHHTIAFVRAGAAGTHHIAFEAASWDAIRRLGDHCIETGTRIEFGPGRHGPGGNIFVYLRDPWGVRWEIFCELQRIDDEAAYRPGRWDPAQRLHTVNRWGPTPPPSFLHE
ncbi:MAG: VOC family protein [Armatimonadota bacterium]|nr:VOC family protein [Armatimonadota bacterium]MDR7486760.1 VOC family protein [Armatimonadota bacterium]MDR7533223.1 VOC family protein [Armatimonadota bacterium]MDR7535389.1 VOC family protein [Armatimonadota bacterium]